MGKWKFNIGDQVVANEKAPGDYRGRKGIIVERGPAKGEYTVEIDGGKTFLNSWWLDAAYRHERGERIQSLIVREIEKPVRVAEDEDIVDIVAENTTDKVVDKTGLTQRLFKRDAAQTRKAIKKFLDKVKPPFPP